VFNFECLVLSFKLFKMFSRQSCAGGQPNERGNPNEIGKKLPSHGVKKMKNKPNLLRLKTSDTRLQTWNLKNKANLKIGKIGVSYYLTSKYEDL